MKDGGGAGEPTEVSRQELYEAYVNCYVQPCTEVQPCRDAELMKKATQYLLREPRSRDAFTVFPFYQAVGENCDALGTDCRTHLSAFIKATELLEIICVNLFLQPWKKEIRTLKTFTGPFVYCLLPVLSSSTLKSVLASIGYLPYTDTPQSEFRLRDDPNPDRAMKLGFELLLARVQCSHFLELLEKDQLGPVEWLEVLQREGSTKLEEPTDKTTTIGQKEEEKKEEEADRKEVPLYLDSRLAMTSQPKPPHLNLLCVDHSIMEMQRIYPDLAFRGRPLVSDKPHQANSSRSSSKDAHTAMGNYGDDGKVAELCKADCIKGTKAAATAVGSRSDSSKAGDVFCDDGRSRGCNDGSSGWSTPPGNTASSSFSHTDGSRVDEELSGPQAISLHITLRAGSKAEPSLKPGECQATAEPPAWTQEQATAERKRLAKSELPSLGSVDEDQNLRELAERMGQLHVQDTREEVKRKEEHKKGQEKTNNERGKKELRKTSTEGGVEEQNLRKPVMETGPALSHGASRCSRSSQHEPAVIREQKGHHTSPLTVNAADCESCKGGGSTGQQEGEDNGKAGTGRGEELLAQSFVIVERHKK